MYSTRDTVICGSYKDGLQYPSVYTIQSYDPLQHVVRLYNAPHIDFSVIPEGWGFSRALAFESIWWQRKFVTLDIFLAQCSPQLPYYNKLQEIYGNFISKYQESNEGQ
jgi:hypothetical protein